MTNITVRADVRLVQDPFAIKVQLLGQPVGGVSLSGEAPNRIGFNLTAGLSGANGWSPVFSLARDGQREVLRIVDWTDGGGAKPATGGYIGSTGIVSSIADAINLRGTPARLAPWDMSSGVYPNNATIPDDARDFDQFNVTAGGYFGGKTTLAGDVVELVDSLSQIIIWRQSGLIEYDRAQALTDAQQQQARNNTGAAGLAEILLFG